MQIKNSAETPSNWWKKLSLSFDHALHKVLRQQYLAAQFLALAGRYLIPEKNMLLGTFATIARDEKGASSKTIGLGRAIPNSMVPEPYFYLSFWSEKPLSIKENPFALPAGK